MSSRIISHWLRQDGFIHLSAFCSTIQKLLWEPHYKTQQLDHACNIPTEEWMPVATEKSAAEPEMKFNFSPLINNKDNPIYPCVCLK